MEGIATVGVVLHLSDVQEDANLSITTVREGAEKALVKLKDVLAGHAQELWGGKACAAGDDCHAANFRQARAK
jgi:hypothetical protein